MFCLRPWNEDSGVHLKVEGPELLMTQNILKRLSRGPSSDQSLKRLSVILPDLTMEPDIELLSAEVHRAAQQKLRIEPGILDPVFFQMIGRPVEYLQDSHCFKSQVDESLGLIVFSLLTDYMTMRRMDYSTFLLSFERLCLIVSRQFIDDLIDLTV